MKKIIVLCFILLFCACSPFVEENENLLLSTITSSPTLTPIPTPTQIPPKSMIVFVSSKQGKTNLFRIDEDGSNLTQLTNNDFGNITPSWSPDGKYIIFCSFRDGDFEIYAMDVFGNNVVQLTHNDYSDSEPVWFSDGKFIAFVSNEDGDDEIFIMNSDGTGRMQITHTNNTMIASPKISPDNNKILYVAWKGDILKNDSEIFVYDLESKKESQITNNDYWDLYPAWSPDGDLIAFSSEKNGNYDIFLMDINGEIIRQVTDDLMDDTSPAWSPDGKKIAFESDSGEGDEIYIINTSGEDRFKLISKGERKWDSSPAWSNYVDFNDLRIEPYQSNVLRTSGENQKKVTEPEYSWDPKSFYEEISINDFINNPNDYFKRALHVSAIIENVLDSDDFIISIGSKKYFYMNRTDEESENFGKIRVGDKVDLYGYLINNEYCLLDDNLNRHCYRWFWADMLEK